jgi:hypothetical protein
MSSNTSKIDVQAALQRIATESNSLNQSTDELNSAIGTLDESLKKFNIGQEAWVEIDSIREGAVNTVYELGYARGAVTWGLTLRIREQDLVGGNVRNDGIWAFNSAPRALRLLGVNKIPDLLQKLAEEVSRLASNVRNKARTVQEIVASIGRENPVGKISDIAKGAARVDGVEK